MKFFSQGLFFFFFSSPPQVAAPATRSATSSPTPRRGTGTSSSVTIALRRPTTPSLRLPRLPAPALVRFPLARSYSLSSLQGLAFQFDVTDVNQRRAEIAEADIVISLLPATMHDDVAEECVSMKKDFLNASYTSPKVKALDAKVRLRPSSLAILSISLLKPFQAKENGVLVLTEMGLDPGIDHMSCMKLVHSILEAGGILSSLHPSSPSDPRL